MALKDKYYNCFVHIHLARTTLHRLFRRLGATTTKSI